MNKKFWIVIGIVFTFGTAFLVRYVYQPRLPDIPSPLIVGTCADMPPLTYKNKKGEIVGFDIDIIKEATRRLHIPIKIIDMPFQILMHHLQVGNVHVIAAGLAKTNERLTKALATPTYLTSNELAVISTQNNPVTNAENFDGKTLAAREDSTIEAFADRLHKSTILPFTNIEDAIYALEHKKADALITSFISLPDILKEYGEENFTYFLLPEAAEQIVLYISRFYPILAQRLTTIIEEMKADGTLSSLKQKWKVL